MNKVVLIVLILCVILSMVRVEKFSNSPSADINDEDIDMSMYKKMEDVDITKDLMQEMVLRTNEEVSKRTGLCTYIIETISADMYEAVAPEIKKDGDIKLPETKAIPQIGSKICKAMFMVVKYGNSGYDFGFIVSSVIRVINTGPRYETTNLDEIAKDTEKELKQSIDSRIEKRDSLNEIEQNRLTRDIKKYTQIQTNKQKYVGDKPKVAVLTLRSQPLNIKKPNNESIFTSNIPHSEFIDYSLVRQGEIEYLKNNSNLLVEKEILDSQSMYGNKDKIVTKPSE